MLLSHDEFNQLMDIFAGIWWHENTPRRSVEIRVRLLGEAPRLHRAGDG
jgi:hypothetical protein